MDTKWEEMSKNKALEEWLLTVTNSEHGYRIRHFESATGEEEKNKDV